MPPLAVILGAVGILVGGFSADFLFGNSPVIFMYALFDAIMFAALGVAIHHRFKI